MRERSKIWLGSLRGPSSHQFSGCLFITFSLFKQKEIQAGEQETELVLCPSYKYPTRACLDLALAVPQYAYFVSLSCTICCADLRVSHQKPNQLPRWFAMKLFIRHLASCQQRSVRGDFSASPTWSTRTATGCGATSTPLWTHRKLFCQLSRNGNLHGLGLSHATTTSPKPSFMAPWRVGGAVAGRGDVGLHQRVDMPELLTMASRRKD